MRVLGAGELAPATGVFEAVSQGAAEMYHAVPTYWRSKSPGIVLFGNMPFGLMAGWYRRLEYLLEPAIWFWYNAPIVAFYPLLILWLGLGSPTIIALAFLLAFVPIYINTFTGMRAVSPQLIQCARSFGCSTLGIFVHVALPGSVPAVIAGLRLGVGRALIGVVIGQLIGGNAGLGYRMAAR